MKPHTLTTATTPVPTSVPTPVPTPLPPVTMGAVDASPGTHMLSQTRKKVEELVALLAAPLTGGGLLLDIEGLKALAAKLDYPILFLYAAWLLVCADQDQANLKHQIEAQKDSWQQLSDHATEQVKFSTFCTRHYAVEISRGEHDKLTSLQVCQVYMERERVLTAGIIGGLNRLYLTWKGVR